MRVTVIRQVPPLVVGACGVVPHRDFDACEERLDGLEANGATVERVEPGSADDVIASRPAVQRLVRAAGARAYPIVLVNDAMVVAGRYPSRTEWAHALGEARRAEELTAAR